MFESIPFAGNALDRLDRVRRDPRAVTALLDDPASRFLPFRELKPWIALEPAPRLGWVERPPVIDGDALLLGTLDGAARFAVDVGDALPGGDGKFIDARSIAPNLAAADSGLLAQARSLLDWHARHRFCATCGAPSRPSPDGHLRRCTSPACAALHFPRNEPVVIMLVTDGANCLLGRQHRYAPDFWSCLAGFVEPGETIEAAVRREVREEAGVGVGAVHYLGSQPWPFPASLMLGCVAEALEPGDDARIDLDPHELVEARWFGRDAVASMLANCGAETGARLPDTVAIAHHLVRHWLDS